ncbi:AAA-like domain-containing protein, partial [Lyngbya confervoides]
MTSPNYDYEFQAGGSLAADAPTYIQRAADEAIYQAVKAGKFAYVFNSRQMGKSSLRVQTENRLKAEGIRCAAIDLSTLGTEEVSAAQWYRSLIGELNRCLDLLPAQEVDAWLEKQVEVTPVFRLHRFIEDVLLVQIPDQRIVIFIDEIDSVLSLSFPASDFFALIRACYNRQVDNAAYRRLTFVLLGVTTPSQLIRDSSRTPFNIGQAIELTPLTLDRATRLADGLSGWVAEPQQVLAKIFYWTGGQPYLTQRLCALVQEKAMEADSLPWIGKGEAAVAVADLMQRQLIHNWETSDEQAHFKTMRDRLLRREHLANRLLGMYEQILTQGSIPKENSDPHMELRLSGLVVSSNGDLRVFNPTYAQIFDIAWVQTTLESLRPYAESFQAWMTSGCTDESRLLRGQTLTEAEAWAKGKGLSDLDDRYLRESQAAENRDVKSALERSEALKQEIEARQQALEQFNQEAEAQIQKQNRRIRNRSRIAVATLIASLVGGAFALSAIVLFNNARDDLDVVREVAQLERAGLAAQEKFSLRETAALWDAFRAAHRAVQIYKESNGNHLASSPILALQMSLEQKKEILLPSFKGAVEQPTTLTEFTPEGNRVLTIMNEHGDIGLWDLEGNLITQFKGHEDLINRANISPNGEYIVTASKDDAIRILSIDGSLIKTMNSISPITNISFSPNGKNFGILEQNGILNIWDSKGSRVSTLGNETDPIEELIFGSNGKIVLLRRAQSNAYILDFLEDKIVNLETNKKTISSIKFSHDRTHILASTDDGWIFIWDLEGNQRLSKQVHGEISEIIPNTDDNNFIIILDGFAELWNFEGTKVADFYPEKWAFDNANFNTEGDTILLREANGFMSLWDLDGNQNAL